MQIDRNGSSGTDRKVAASAHPIPTSTKVNQAAMAQTSVHSLDRTAKVSREFRQLALIIVQELGLLLFVTELLAQKGVR